MVNESLAKLLLELRKGGVNETAILRVIESVPRDIFLSAPFKSRTYENVALPIGCHQTISQPLVVALMTQALELTDMIKVLEIGTGSGYQTVVLSPLCRRVYTIERYPELLRLAEKRFEELKISNVTTLLGDGSSGWPSQAPFERIIVTPAATDIPLVLLDQLAIGGKMIIPIGLTDEDQRLTKVIKKVDGVETLDMGPVRFVPLVAEGVPT